MCFLLSLDTYQRIIVSIVLLTGFSLAICYGPMILASSIFGELMPVRASGFCLVIVSLFTHFLIGSSLKVSPYLFKSLDYQGTFLFFAAMSTLLLIITYYVLPETKDMTLHEIANIWKKNVINP